MGNKIINTKRFSKNGWDKDTLIEFVKLYCPNTSVVYDNNNNNKVIVKVNSYEDAKKLGGYGETLWCIAMEKPYWKKYVTDHKDNIQYFYFDFAEKTNKYFYRCAKCNGGFFISDDDYSFIAFTTSLDETDNTTYIKHVYSRWNHCLFPNRWEQIPTIYDVLNQDTEMYKAIGIVPPINKDNN